MSTLMIIGIAYAGLTVAEFAFLAVVNHRRKKNSPRVEVSGDWEPLGASGTPPAPSTARLSREESPHSYFGEMVRL